MLSAIMINVYIYRKLAPGTPPSENPRSYPARCALNMEIFDLLNEESVPVAAVVELVYKFDICD